MIILPLPRATPTLGQMPAVLQANYWCWMGKLILHSLSHVLRLLWVRCQRQSQQTTGAGWVSYYTASPTCYTPGANLTYLAPPRTIFHGCQIVHWDPRNAKNFVLKDKLNCTMKKCMVSMATIYTILEHGVGHRILPISQLLLILNH